MWQKKTPAYYSPLDLCYNIFLSEQENSCWHRDMVQKDRCAHLDRLSRKSHAYKSCNSYPGYGAQSLCTYFRIIPGVYWRKQESCPTFLPYRSLLSGPLLPYYYPYRSLLPSPQFQKIRFVNHLLKLISFSWLVRNNCFRALL